MESIVISNHLIIPLSEIKFTASRSSKPGGQNVNKVSTRITLNFNVQISTSIDDEQKSKIIAKLHTRINKDGILKVSSQKHRTQLANKNATIERFTKLLQNSLVKTQERKSTKVPKSEKKKRLEDKKHRSRLKQSRSKNISIDE